MIFPTKYANLILKLRYRNLILNIFSMLMLLVYSIFLENSCKYRFKTMIYPTKYDDSGSFGVIGFLCILFSRWDIVNLILAFFRCLFYF